MNSESTHSADPMIAVLRRWGDVSVTRKTASRVLHGLLESCEGKDVLAVLAEDVIVSDRLRQTGGRWQSVTTTEDPGPVMHALYGKGTPSLREGKLPHPDGRFDLVLVDQVLEHFEDDAGLVAECHRVLKESGSLVLRTPRTAPWSLARSLRRLLGVGDYGRGKARAGYTEAQLFDVLKDGFDAAEERTWSRFFTEFVETLIQLGVILVGAGRMPEGEQVGDRDRLLLTYRRMVNLHAAFYPLALVAALLDRLLFLSRGHEIALRARRRPWKPRRRPTPLHGRSIADAAINTKIGTAGPFQT